VGEHLLAKDNNIENFKTNNHVHLTNLKNLLWNCMEFLFAKNEPLSHAFTPPLS
jgi:hypothetical protein